MPAGARSMDLTDRREQSYRVVNDFHVHTRYSGQSRGTSDPRMTPQAVCQRAGKLGYRRIGFTDHLYCWTSYQDLVDLHEAVRNVRVEGVEVFFGSEVELSTAQSTGMPSQWRGMLDYVLLALEHDSGPTTIPIPELDDPHGWIQRYKIGCQVAAAGGAEVLAHPFYRCLAVLDVISDADLRQMLETLAEGGVALELNAPRLTRELGRVDWTRLVITARDIGVKFSIGGDAHHLEDFGRASDLEPLLEQWGIDDSMLWIPRGICG